MSNPAQARRGVSRDRLLSTLREMGAEMPAASVAMLRWAAARPGLEVRVLSDCNQLFISHMLTGTPPFSPRHSPSPALLGIDSSTRIFLGPLRVRAAARFAFLHPHRYSMHVRAFAVSLFVQMPAAFGQARTSQDCGGGAQVLRSSRRSRR